MRESTIQNAIRLQMGKLRNLFLRFHVGTFFTPDGSRIRIGEPGVSDLIGVVPHVVRPEDVGRTIGVFTALETKQLRDSTSAERRKNQAAFLRAVNRAGGIGAIVRSEDDALDVVTRKWESPLVQKFSVDPEAGM